MAYSMEKTGTQATLDDSEFMKTLQQLPVKTQEAITKVKNILGSNGLEILLDSSKFTDIIDKLPKDTDQALELLKNKFMEKFGESGIGKIVNQASDMITNFQGSFNNLSKAISNFSTDSVEDFGKSIQSVLGETINLTQQTIDGFDQIKGFFSGSPEEATAAADETKKAAEKGSKKKTGKKSTNNKKTSSPKRSTGKKRAARTRAPKIKPLSTKAAANVKSVKASLPGKGASAFKALTRKGGSLKKLPALGKIFGKSSGFSKMLKSMGSLQKGMGNITKSAKIFGGLMGGTSKIMGGATKLLGGMGKAMGGLNAASACVETAIAGWEIGKKIGEALELDEKFASIFSYFNGDTKKHKKLDKARSTQAEQIRERTRKQLAELKKSGKITQEEYDKNIKLTYSKDAKISGKAKSFIHDVESGKRKVSEAAKQAQKGPEKESGLNIPNSQVSKMSLRQNDGSAAITQSTDQIEAKEQKALENVKDKTSRYSRGNKAGDSDPAIQKAFSKFIEQMQKQQAKNDDVNSGMGINVERIKDLVKELTETAAWSPA